MHTKLIPLVIARGEVEDQLHGKKPQFEARRPGAHRPSPPHLAMLLAPQPLPLALPLLASLAAEAGECAGPLLLGCAIVGGSHRCCPSLIGMSWERCGLRRQLAGHERVALLCGHIVLKRCQRTALRYGKGRGLQ